MHKKCEHGRERYRCKDCGGSSFCEHGRQRSRCKDYGGGGICEHGRQRNKCKVCGGSSFCEHGRQRTRCEECGGGDDVPILDAREVGDSEEWEEEDSESDEVEEWIPTGRARVVGGSRGGKRKR